MSGFRPVGNLWKRVRRSTGVLTAAIAGCFLGGLPAVARAEGTSGISGPHGPTVPALLVILFLALALIILVRTSRRHAESKLEKYDEE